MRRGMLINTSRGPIVDEAALIEALRAGWIAGAGLDVFDEEPVPLDSPFRTLPNVLHAAPRLRVAGELPPIARALEDIHAYLAGAASGHRPAHTSHHANHPAHRDDGRPGVLGLGRKAHVIESDPNDDWQWETELNRAVPWRDQLIAELDGVPIGFVQILDPAAEETHYWGDVPTCAPSTSGSARKPT